MSLPSALIAELTYFLENCDAREPNAGTQAVRNRANAYRLSDDRIAISVRTSEFGEWVFRTENGRVEYSKSREMQMVAAAIERWGPPPNAVIEDWKQQFCDREDLRSKPTTADVFAMRDGTFAAGSELDWRQSSELPDPLVALLAGLEQMNLPAAPEWPWLENDSPVRTDNAEASNVETSPAILWSGQESFDVSKVASAPNQSKQSHFYRTFAVGLGMVALSVIAGWTLLYPSDRVLSGGSLSGGNLSGGNLPGGKSQSSLAELTPESESENLEVMSAEPLTFDKPSEFDDSDITLDSVLQKMHSTGELQPLDFRNLTLDSIIAPRSLSLAIDSSSGSDAIGGLNAEGKLVDGTGMDLGTADDGGIEAEIATDGLIELADGGFTLKEIFSIQAAAVRKVIPLGKRVLPKDCRCEVRLTLPKGMVMEPTEVLTLEGEDTLAWRIAIEDSDPELVVILHSKPSSRWQIDCSVGVRAGREGNPMRIGPNDGRMVVNRLIAYDQWLLRSKEGLRDARANLRGKSSIDFSGEIRKLELQQRLVEKAKKFWIGAEAISQKFFDDNSIQVQFVARERPVLKAD